MLQLDIIGLEQLDDCTEVIGYITKPNDIKGGLEHLGQQEQAEVEAKRQALVKEYQSLHLGRAELSQPGGGVSSPRAA
ncbi:unnamed protein product, partial [marine sediment metagenome]